MPPLGIDCFPDYTEIVFRWGAPPTSIAVSWGRERCSIDPRVALHFLRSGDPGTHVQGGADHVPALRRRTWPRHGPGRPVARRGTGGLGRVDGCQLDARPGARSGRAGAGAPRIHRPGRGPPGADRLPALRVVSGRQRRALSNIDGPVEVFGDPLVGALLRTAFDACRAPMEAASPIHGFHTYPARMHPKMAEVLVGAFASAGDVVLDPFCGGGTVVVEARLAGCRALGADLSPLAVRIAAVRSDPGTRAMRGDLLRAASDVARSVREGRAPRFRIPRREVSWYAPHVLGELSALRGAIGGVRHGWLRERLLLVFSSLVVKASSQRADTAARRVERRLPRGAVTRWFEARTKELVSALEHLAAAISRGTPPAHFVRADARTIDEVFGRHAVDLVLSSPPYGGTYDYVDHHARRYPWLGIDPRRFEDAEIGARRRSRASPVAAFDGEVEAYLRALGRVARPTGHVVLLLGDGRWAGRRIDVRRQIERLAPPAGLVPRAWARQPRPGFDGTGRRFEWLVALEPVRRAARGD
ncbi:MAG: hypothetical protein D6705_06380 [Deltaproteobacteria bacterium]|nr:MAG: hypothetical protein D6705_06380 [Deltaproteobacteria bacterium]